MDSDHVSEEEFLLEFFGLYGRELGDPDQIYHDNPTDIIEFVKTCEIEKKPAFVSVQPRKAHKKVTGIEKLFFDFDYADKTYIKKLDVLLKTEFPDDKEREAERTKILDIRKSKLKMEVMKFVNMLINERTPRLQPMLVKTRKGYHVYIYFDKVYSLGCEDDFLKETYATLTGTLRGLYESRYGPLEYSDTSVERDVFRIARIPLSVHEVSGERCMFMKLSGVKSGNFDLEQDKIRGLAYFKNYSLKQDDMFKAIRITKLRIAEKAKAREEAKANSDNSWETTHGYVGHIRPCFQKALESGEMCHQQRLALLTEAWYSGIKSFEGLVEIFRPLHDFDGDKSSQSTCRYQCQWFLDHEGYNVPPYTCDTIQKLGWCIENECKLYRRRKNE